jgi:hypothetical protein
VPINGEQHSPKSERSQIRKDSLVEDVYLGRDGTWTTWERAASFLSVEALERFAAKHGIEVFGIF